MDTYLYEIENALINGDFFLEYLPIIELEGGFCIGAEALIRWKRQSKVVQPMEFIPLIENTPLSGLLTYWVIERISHELGNWLRNTEDIFISVNVPPEILGRGGIGYVAYKCGLFDIIDKFVIEITERGVPDQLGLKSIHEARKRGLKICLDDVGSSDENLVLFARANIDMVKLEKSFADKMLQADWSSASMSGFAAITKATKVQVIAEGIETEFQRNTFQEVGIQMGQGWLFSAPLSAEDFRQFFQGNQG